MQSVPVQIANNLSFAFHINTHKPFSTTKVRIILFVSPRFYHFFHRTDKWSLPNHRSADNQIETNLNLNTPRLTLSYKIFSINCTRFDQCITVR